MCASAPPTTADRWVLGGLLLLVHPLVPAAIVATSYAVGPGASDEPLLARLINAPAVGLIYALLGAWPGILAAAVAQPLLRVRVPLVVELLLVTATSALALTSWFGVFFGRLDPAVAALGCAIGAAWALTGFGVVALQRRWARRRTPRAA